MPRAGASCHWGMHEGMNAGGRNPSLTQSTQPDDPSRRWRFSPPYDIVTCGQVEGLAAQGLIRPDPVAMRTRLVTSMLSHAGLDTM